MANNQRGQQTHGTINHHQSNEWISHGSYGGDWVNGIDDPTLYHNTSGQVQTLDRRSLQAVRSTLTEPTRRRAHKQDPPVWSAKATYQRDCHQDMAKPRTEPSVPHGSDQTGVYSGNLQAIQQRHEVPENYPPTQHYLEFAEENPLGTQPEQPFIERYPSHPATEESGEMTKSQAMKERRTPDLLKEKQTDSLEAQQKSPKNKKNKQKNLTEGERFILPPNELQGVTGDYPAGHHPVEIQRSTPASMSQFDVYHGYPSRTPVYHQGSQPAVRTVSANASLQGRTPRTLGDRNMKRQLPFINFEAIAQFMGPEMQELRSYRFQQNNNLFRLGKESIKKDEFEGKSEKESLGEMQEVTGIEKTNEQPMNQSLNQRVRRQFWGRDPERQSVKSVKITR